MKSTELNKKMTIKTNLQLHKQLLMLQVTVIKRHCFTFVPLLNLVDFNSRCRLEKPVPLCVNDFSTGFMDSAAPVKETRLEMWVVDMSVHIN